IDHVALELRDPIRDPLAQLRQLDQLAERLLVGDRDLYVVELLAMAAPAQLIEAIEDEPPHALAELALLGRKLLQPLPLAARDPARHQRAKDVAGRVRAAVVHRLLDPPDDPLELAGDLDVDIDHAKIVAEREHDPIAPVFGGYDQALDPL